MPFFKPKSIYECAKNNKFRALCRALKSADLNDVNATETPCKYTALHEAALNENLKITRELLKHRADPNIQNAHGNTAMHYSIQRADLKMIHELLKAGADPTIKNNENMSPFDMAKDRYDNLINNHGAVTSERLTNRSNISNSIAYNFRQILALMNAHAPDYERTSKKATEDETAQMNVELAQATQSHFAKQKKSLIKLKKR